MATDQGNKQLRVEDALEYLDQVGEECVELLQLARGAPQRASES